MQNPESSIRLRAGTRFRLSPRGQSTAAAYAAALRVVRRAGRPAFEQAQTQWAQQHGLEADDGIYLAELALESLNLGRLGEALAVCGQSRERLMAVVRRLIVRGFVEQIETGTGTSSETAVARAQREVTVAEAELDDARIVSGPTDLADRRVIDGPLREAMYRHVVARRFFASLQK